MAKKIKATFGTGTIGKKILDISITVEQNSTLNTPDYGKGGCPDREAALDVLPYEVYCVIAGETGVAQCKHCEGVEHEKGEVFVLCNG